MNRSLRASLRGVPSTQGLGTSRRPLHVPFRTYRIIPLILFLLGFCPWSSQSSDRFVGPKAKQLASYRFAIPFSPLRGEEDKRIYERLPIVLSIIPLFHYSTDNFRFIKNICLTIKYFLVVYWKNKHLSGDCLWRRM